jgi:hypothetical protein
MLIGLQFFQGETMFRKVLLSLLMATTLLAQTERGNITGVVSDQTGAAVAGAQVMITNIATNTTLNVPTTSAGEYNAPSLTPGEYRIDVSAPSFKRYVRDKVNVSASITVRVDVQLSVGQVTESIEVSSAVSQVQTESAKVSTGVENKLVDQLPLVVAGALRSPFDLVSVTPESKGTGQKLAIGGGQVAQWDATLDGLSVGTNRSADTAEAAYNAPSVEAITEFTIDTNGFKAEYGQAGGGVMTFVSKSGTNDYHGSAYDFLRNDDMDARGFFAPTRAVYKQNDFGATMGGPVLIPKLYNGKNKTFFFISYEGFRNRAGSNNGIFSVPTPEMYTGDFSKWVDSSNKLIQIYDPATTGTNPSGSGTIRTPFPGNIIPQNRFAQFSQSLLPFGSVVKPNRGGVPGTSAYVRNNYIATGGSLVSPTDKGSVKVDQNLGSKQRIGFLFNKTQFNQDPGPGGPPGLPLPLYTGQQLDYAASVYRLSHDYTISPNLLNHFSIGGNTFIKNSFSPNSGGNWKSKVCLKNVVDCNVNFPVISFSEFQQWGDTTYNGTEQPMWALKDDLSYIHGKHTFKFGYAFQSQRANGFGEQNISGAAGFSFLGTGVPGVTSFTSGSSFASFLLGVANSGNTETIRFVPQLYDYHGVYAQDDWHVTRKITVNLGLRYDVTTPPVSLNDQYSDFSPTTPNPAINGFPGALIFAGTGPGRTGNRSLVPGWYGGIGPRIGIAYAPTEKTTFRTGFGRSFSRVTAVQGSGHYAGFIGQYAFSSPDQGITPAFNVDQGLPSYPLPPQINPSFANNNSVDWWQGQQATRAPESLSWTFSMQHQLTSKTLIEADYNATVGTHLQTGVLNYNQVPTAIYNQLLSQYGPTQALNILRADMSSATARAANIPIPYPNFTDPTVQQQRTVNQALRPFPQYQTLSTGVQNGDKSGHSSYHALVLKAERRFSENLTFQWNYTFSKLLTDSDTYFASSASAEDQYNRRLEKSIGAYDQTHNLKLATLYELPFGKGKRWVSHGWATWAIGGWRVAGIQTYSSGTPIGVTRNNPLPIFNGQDRPTITTYDNWRPATVGGSFDPAVDKYLDKNVFPTQLSYAFGNETRFNPKLRAFSNLNENISLAKTFRIGERFRLDLRGEAFNLFNRVVFGSPSASLDSNTFGVITSQANTPRQMQVALKLYW